MISVIMSTYNEPLDYIKKSVDSILQQTYKKIEFLVIVDNPSRKDVVDYLQEISAKDKRIRVIKNKTNIGLTASLNKAIGKAKGNYIARMDADDISLPERLELQLDFLKKGNYQLIGSNTISIDSNEKPISEKINYYPGDCKIITKYLKYNSPLAHPTWFGRAELFKKYNYIDYSACEDYEFLTRIVLDNNKIGNIRKPLLKYRINDDGISENKRAIQKTSLYYISKIYRKNKKCDFNVYSSFINGADGKRIYHKMKAYYDTINIIKNDISSKKYLIAIFRYLKLVAHNGIAIEKTINSLQCMLLRKKDEKKVGNE